MNASSEQKGAKPQMRGFEIALSVLASLLPIWIVLAHRGIAPTLIAMGLVVGLQPSLWRRGARFILAGSSSMVWAARFFFIFCLWAATTGVWAVNSGDARVALNVLAPALAAGAIVVATASRPAGEARILAQVFVGGLIVAVLALLFEATSGGVLRALTPPTDESYQRFRDFVALGRGATIIAIILFPALALLAQYRKGDAVSIALFFAALLISLRFGIFSNTVALAAGAVAYFFSLTASRKAARVIVGLWIAAFALAPFAALIPADALIADYDGRAPASWLQRLMIWRAAAQSALDCLPLGCGVEYARSIHELGATIEIAGTDWPLSVMPLHPHSLFLQIWLELGVPGVALLALTVFFGGRAIMASGLGATERAAVAAVAAAFLVSALVETSIWQVWRVSALGLAAIFVGLSHLRRSGRV